MGNIRDPGKDLPLCLNISSQPNESGKDTATLQTYMIKTVVYRKIGSMKPQATRVV